MLQNNTDIDSNSGIEGAVVLLKGRGRGKG